MKRKCIGFFCAIITAFIALMGNVKAVTPTEINKTEASANSGVFDIVANAGSTPIGTTFDTDGYEVTIKVGNGELVSLVKADFGVEKTVDGIKVLITSAPTQEGKGVKISYKLTNTTDEAKDVKIAVTSDIEVGTNDEAAVTKTADHSKIIMTQDYDRIPDTYRACVTVNMDPVATTTWIGYYYDRTKNSFVDGTKMSYINVDDVDTGLAFSWNVTVPANDNKTVSSEFVVSEAPAVTARFFRYNNNTETPDETKEEVMGGSLNFPTNTKGKDGVYYKWNTKRDGTGIDHLVTTGNGTYAILVTEPVNDFYEVDYAGKLRMYYEDDKYYELDKDEELPPVFVNPPDGYYLEGVYLDPDFKTPITSDKMPDKDIHVYYNWVQAKETFNSKFMDDFDKKTVVDFSEVEQAKLDANGAFDLQLKVNDITDMVNETEKSLIIGRLVDGAAPIMYFDASLFKVYSDGDSVVVSKTKDKIKIAIEVSEEVANSYSSFALIRIHDGKTDVIDATIETIDDKKMLIFSSDAFSTYALVNANDVKPDTIKNPKTGDSITVYMLLLVVSLLSLGLIIDFRKNN